MTRRLGPVRALACLGVCGLWTIVSAGQAPDTPTIAIAAPADGSYVKGPTPLVASVEPASAASSVVFSVDGRQVCSLARPPFSCDWDAGTSIVEHQIRLVVNLAGGGRTVRTATTKSLENVFSASVDTVQVIATVTSGSRFVRGLTQDAFHVFEDNVPQTVVQFASDDLPLELVVAVDMSTSVEPAMPRIKQAVKEFLASVSSNDRVTLLGFNDRVFTLMRRETNPAARASAVDSLTASGSTALYDVIIQSADLLDRQAGRRAIVVFTDGEDQGSRSLIDAVEGRLRRTDVTLFMIGQGRGVESRPLQRVMRRLVEPTGGRALFTEKIEDLHEAFADIRAELASQYMLGYVSTNAERDGTWRHIRVDVDGRRQIRTRQGYQAPSGF